MATEEKYEDISEDRDGLAPEPKEFQYTSSMEEDLGNEKGASLEIGQFARTRMPVGPHRGTKVTVSQTSMNSAVNPKTSSSLPLSKGPIPEYRAQELGVLAIRNCLLSNNITNDYFRELNKIVEGMGSTDSKASAKNHRILLANYKEGQSVELLLNMVKIVDEGNADALDVRRMLGNAFVAQSFLDELRGKMLSAGLLSKKYEDEDDDEDGEDDDDDEEDDSFPELDEELSSSYLKFSRDVPAIHFWLKQLLAERNYLEESCHNMGLFAYNAELKENLQAVIDAAGEKLIAALNKYLPQNSEMSCTALAVWTAKLANHCCANESFRALLIKTEKAEELISNLLKAIDEWKSDKEERTFELTSSRQTVLEATSALEHLNENCEDLKPFMIDFFTALEAQDDEDSEEED